MKLYFLVHRWFRTGEGWAYSAELSDTFRNIALERTIAGMRERRDGDVSFHIRERNMALWFRDIGDDDCLDRIAVGKSPRISIAVVCIPAPDVDDGEVKEAVEELFSAAMAVETPGAKAGTMREISRERPFSTKPISDGGERERRKFQPLVLWAVAAIVMGVMGYLFLSRSVGPRPSTPAMDIQDTAPSPSGALVPPARNSFDGPSPAPPLITDVPIPSNTAARDTQTPPQPGEDSALWSEEAGSLLAGELRRHFASDKLEDALKNGAAELFLRLHTRMGLEEWFGVKIEDATEKPGIRFAADFPAETVTIGNSPDALLKALQTLAGSKAAPSVEPRATQSREKSPKRLLEEIRHRFNYREWFAAAWESREEGERYAPDQWGETGALRNLTLAFSPADTSGERREESAIVMAILPELCGDNALPPVSLEEVEKDRRPWLVYAAFFAVLENVAELTDIPGLAVDPALAAAFIRSDKTLRSGDVVKLSKDKFVKPLAPGNNRDVYDLYLKLVFQEEGSDRGEQSTPGR